MYHQAVRVSYSQNLEFTKPLVLFHIHQNTTFSDMHASYLHDDTGLRFPRVTLVFTFYFPCVIFPVLYRSLRLPTFSSVYFPALTQRGYILLFDGFCFTHVSTPVLHLLKLYPSFPTIIKRKPGRSKYPYLLTSLSPPSYYTGDLSLANPLHRGRICRYSVSPSRDQRL